jgi:hypothetical protein
MSTTAQITPEDITGMVRHWLETPPDGYLGSPYGADVKALLQRPQSDNVALSEFLAKMRRDLPVLDYLPAGAVSAWMERSGVDKMVLHVDVAGTLIKAGGAE